MSFDRSKFNSIIGACLPLIAMLIPHGEKLAPVIVKGITDAEAMADAKGADKKQHVLDLVADAVKGVNAGADKTVVDPDQINEAASSAIETVIGVANIVHSNHPGETVPNPDAQAQVAKMVERANAAAPKKGTSAQGDGSGD